MMRNRKQKMKKTMKTMKTMMKKLKMIKTIMKKIKKTLKQNQKTDERVIPKNGSSGPAYPPRYIVAIIAAPINIFTYSARKKKAHLKPVYSV